MTTKFFKFLLFPAKTLKCNLTYLLEKEIRLMSMKVMYPIIVIQILNKRINNLGLDHTISISKISLQ